MFRTILAEILEAGNNISVASLYYKIVSEIYMHESFRNARNIDTSNESDTIAIHNLILRHCLYEMSSHAPIDSPVDLQRLVSVTLDLQRWPARWIIL